MKINLILFSAELNDKPANFESPRPLFEGLRVFYDINTITSSDYISYLERFPSQAAEENLTVAFIASGGTEDTFLTLFPFLKQPVIILSDGYNNSFAAACEICTWLENNDIEHISIHVPLEADRTYFEELSGLLKKMYNHILIKQTLKGENIGLLGGSSSWLIASHVSKSEVEERYGVSFIDIKITEFTELYENIKGSGKDFRHDPLFREYRELLTGGRTETDLAEALAAYYALDKICSKYGLNAVTIKCFDIISLCRVTVCLAAAILNDRGIVVGCEGDIPAVITMLILHKGGRRGFMVNPASADKEKLTVDFAHCTVPFSMTESFRLSSHFESSMSIGIKGILPLGRYSMVKFSGKNLERHYHCSGSIVSIPDVPVRCRTQVKFRFDTSEDFEMFMAGRFGNHVVLFKGNI